MVIRKAFKYRLKTNQAIEQQLGRIAGCARFVWNRALAIELERLGTGEKLLGYAELCALLTVWRHDPATAFLAECPVHTQQQTLRDLSRALRDGLSKSSAKRMPRFKKKGRDLDSFRYPDPKQLKLESGRVFLPKIGWVRYRDSRPVVGTPAVVTVSRRGEHWYVSIQTEREIAEPIHPSTTEVGGDLGIARFVTFSSGEVVEPLDSFRKLEDKLALEQRRLARKQKGSANWKEQKARISRLHIRIADARNDFLHKVSTRTGKTHATVYLEDLKVANMSASAKGTTEDPGRNVKAKSGLNKAILDRGWYEFRRQLAYKLRWLGGTLFLVPPRDTSRRCSACGHTAAENRPCQAVFRCVQCGHSENADLNAAKNVLGAGQALSACGAIKPVAA
ncbi:MAG: transposase [Candidatus Schekmanbacteria bacterium]|nr:transposase [Candidatus Schekmanbacteria bacterium]